MLELVQAQKDPTAGEEERGIEQKEKDGVSSSLRFEMHIFFFCKNVHVGTFKITVFFTLSTNGGDPSLCDPGPGGVLICVCAVFARHLLCVRGYGVSQTRSHPEKLTVW